MSKENRQEFIEVKIKLNNGILLSTFCEILNQEFTQNILYHEYLIQKNIYKMSMEDFILNDYDYQKIYEYEKDNLPFFTSSKINFL